jgi:AcrR family transcriptional regulator
MREEYARQSNYTIRLEKDLSRAIVLGLQKYTLSDMTFSDLCQYSNYSRSSFYKYYYDLEDLFTDYLLQVWESIPFSDDGDFFQVTKRLLNYQQTHPECAQILSVNRSCTTFLESFCCVMRQKIIAISFMEKALQRSSFPSREFITDYLLKCIELLSGYTSTLRQSELSLISERLLHHPFTEKDACD